MTKTNTNRGRYGQQNLSRNDAFNQRVDAENS
jgi:hypothetical protein